MHRAILLTAAMTLTLAGSPVIAGYLEPEATHAAIAPWPTFREDDDAATIWYSPMTGDVSIEVHGGTLTSINIDSSAGVFVNHENAQNLDGSFDNHSDGNIFKATFGSSFGSLSFGQIAEAGLSNRFCQNDLSVIGSWAGGGALTKVDGCYMPEYRFIEDDPPSFATLKAALREGNPDAIVTFNSGVRVPAVSTTRHDDYIAGEFSRELPDCPGDWVEKDGHKARYHSLSYLGKTWGQGKAPRLARQ